MKFSRGQQELFSNTSSFNELSKENELELDSSLLQNWQKRLNDYQSRLFKNPGQVSSQVPLFSKDGFSPVHVFNPLDLTPLPINFWRLSKNPYQGPAIYLVMDKPKGFETPILLYIGETISAERRWKGEHDCKSYISAYLQALVKAKLSNKLSIRFWSDVPQRTKARRKIEQQLIRLWLPPFNKETRSRWATPFTAGIK